MTQVFLTPHTNWPGLEPPCDVEESSVPLQIPASDRKAIPFPMTHHYWYCKPLPLGNHPHPDEDGRVPGKENRGPEGAWAHSSLPELLAICSPVSMYSERTEEQEGGGMMQGRAALSYSQLLSVDIGKEKLILPGTPCCEWQLDVLCQEPEWAAAATAETTHLQNVRVGDFFEELQVCREMKKKSDFFFLLKLPGFRETQVGNYSWNCYLHLRALHWSHSQMKITSFFKENGYTVWVCGKLRNWLTWFSKELLSLKPWTPIHICCWAGHSWLVDLPGCRELCGKVLFRWLLG